MWYEWAWRMALVNLLVGGGILLSSSIYGAEWSVELNVRAGGEFNDNLTLTPRPHSTTWGTRVKPDVRMQYATEVMQIQSGGSFEYVRYFGQDAQSLINATVPLSATYQGERDRWRGSYRFTRDNTLQSELDNTGVVLTFSQRNAHQVGLDWDCQITERLELQIGSQFQDVVYEKGNQFNLFDFQVYAGTIGGAYQINEQITLRANSIYSNFFAPDAQFRTQSGGLELGLGYRLTEIWTLNLLGGGRYVHSAQHGSFATTNNDLVWLVSSSLSGKWERNSGTLSYERTLNPSGSGQLIQSDRFSLGINHQWTERLSLGLEASAFLTSGVGTSNGSRGRIGKTHFFQLGPSVRWRATETGGVSLGYSYRWRKSRLSDQTASGNSVTLFWTEQIGRMAVSR